MKRTIQTDGAVSIAAERIRQQQVEGFTSDNDDVYLAGELSRAGALYALYAFAEGDKSVPAGFPWGEEWWKLKSPRENLVRAGALIAAETDRLDRGKT